MSKRLVDIIKEATLAKNTKKRYRRSFSLKKRYKPKIDLAEKNEPTEVIINPTSDSKVELPLSPTKY